ncbi:MAG: metallophosphoesterase, partial [Betaproteobacteria bacterium]
MGYDVIGDIHGQAGKLEALLRKLGYVPRACGWVPPHGRQAVFLGDLIDRGPEQVK